MVFGLGFYLGLIKESIEEPFEFFKDVKDNWDWYDIPGSLFGFDIFSPRFHYNPMTEEDKKSFTESLPDIIKPNFYVTYNRTGMILTGKKFKPKLATILNN